MTYYFNAVFQVVRSHFLARKASLHAQLQKRVSRQAGNAMERMIVLMGRTRVTVVSMHCEVLYAGVAQWLEHLTGHQKITDCTHM